MRIRVITGQQGINILESAKEYKGDIIKFPETEICHSYDLCEHIMQIVQDYFDIDKCLIIVTYSEVVLDAVRLWVARNKFEDAECINVLSDGNIINVPIDENGDKINIYIDEQGFLTHRQSLIYDLQIVDGKLINVVDGLECASSYEIDTENGLFRFKEDKS